jgi:hypothetical protein
MIALTGVDAPAYLLCCAVVQVLPTSARDLAGHQYAARVGAGLYCLGTDYSQLRLGAVFHPGRRPSRQGVRGAGPVPVQSAARRKGAAERTTSREASTAAGLQRLLLAWSQAFVRSNWRRRFGSSTPPFLPLGANG